MTKINAEQLLLTTKHKIKSLRKGVARPRRYPDNIRNDILSLLEFYSKGELSTNLGISNSLITRYEVESSDSTGSKKNHCPDFVELSSSLVKKELPKVKMELTVNNVHIKIFE